MELAHPATERDAPAAGAAGARSRHPAAVFALTAVAGWLVLVSVTIAVGLLLVHVLLPTGGVATWDDNLSRDLVRTGTPLFDDLSYVGSLVGDIPVLPGLVVIAVAVLLKARDRVAAAFVATAGLLELATYRVTSLVVHRDRPPVVRLDELPGNQSYPSGHVAASVAVYGALAVVITAYTARQWLITAAWSLAVLLPAAVALSRMYRGMHHLTDVIAGALMGLAALLLAYRAARRCVAAGGRPSPITEDRP